MSRDHKNDLPGCASLIAFEGSAFDVTRRDAFSLGDSVRLVLEKDPMLLRFLLLVKLNSDLVRGLCCCSSTSAMVGAPYVLC